MIRAMSYVNATEMHDDVCDMLVFGKHENDRDWTHGTEVGLHNVAIHCASFDWSFDLKRLWIPPSRWTMMVRQYIDPHALDRLLEQVGERLVGKGRGIAVLRTRTVEGRGEGRGVRRRWGSCMLSLSYRTNPRPTVALHSRTSYFGYLAAMDISVAHAFARSCGEITGRDPRDMQFVWTLDLAQFHGFRSLAWALGDPDIKEQMDQEVDDRFTFSARLEPGNTPGYRKVLDGYARILASDRAGKPYGDEAFSSFARVRRRFHTEVMGVEYSRKFAGGTLNRGGKGPFPPLPSVMSDTLTLESALLRNRNETVS